MRRLFLGVALVASACSGMTVRPSITERTDPRRPYTAMYAASFHVECDSCRVSYGRQEDPYRDVVDGSWDGEVSLGTMRSGQKVRVILWIRPVGEARILRAEIAAGGATVAHTEDKDPGEAVDLSARVGPL